MRANQRFLAALLLCTACADNDQTRSGAAIAQDPGSACGLENSTEFCACADDLPGRQVCGASGWGECECQTDEGIVTSSGHPAASADTSGSVPGGNLRSDIEFEWERTEASEGSCEPGNYAGDFKGLYASQLTFINFPIPVFALGQLDRPGLAFTLEKKGDGEKLEIADGVMEGTADGLFPFRGTITGSLDCKTGKFDSILSGFYSLGAEGVGMFKFKGPLTGQYDKLSRSISMGTWKVDEYDPVPVLPNAGGAGDWSASWKNP